MRQAWICDEDAQFRRLVTTHGHQWMMISSLMENRSASQVCGRWEKYLDPKLVKDPSPKRRTA
jgi:hypothetical protein